MPDYSDDVGAQHALRRFADELKEQGAFYRQESARFLSLAEECERNERAARQESNRYPKPLVGPGAPDGGK